MEKKRSNWTDMETHFLLTIMRDNNILNMLDGKRYRNTDIFQIVEEELKKRGFLKSALQIRTKWKTLKLNYYRAKRNNNTSGKNREESPFWEELDELLGHRPACNVTGVDTSTTVDTSDIENCNVTGVDMSTTIDTSDIENFDGVDIIESELVDNSDKNVDKVHEMHVDCDSAVRTPEGKKAGYNEALKTFSRDLKESQKEIANYFLTKQAEIIKKELEEQREWEKKILEEDRLATEKMINNMMTCFFNNMRGFAFPNTVHQIHFFNPSQTSLHASSTLLPFSMPPSPLSPTEINSPQLSPSVSTPELDKNGPSNEGNKNK